MSEFDITKPSQRALAAWANQIQEHASSLNIVTNVEVLAAYTKLRHEQGDAYPAVYFTTLNNLNQWSDSLWGSDVDHLASLVTLARGMNELRKRTSRTRVDFNINNGDNDNGT